MEQYNFREDLINGVRDAGQYLISHADVIVGDSFLGSGLEIRIHLKQPTRKHLTKIEVRHEYKTGEGLPADE